MEPTMSLACERLESRNVPAAGLSAQQLLQMAEWGPLNISTGPTMSAAFAPKPVPGTSKFVFSDTHPLDDRPGNTDNGNQPPPRTLTFYIQDPFIGFELLGGAITAPIDGATLFDQHQIVLKDTSGNVVFSETFDGSKPLYCAIDNGIFPNANGEYTVCVNELINGQIVWTHLQAVVFLGQFDGAIPN
jgi:hypothetical protein